jgi:hypothetical protein
MTATPDRPGSPAARVDVAEILRRTEAAKDWAWDDNMPLSVREHFATDVPDLIAENERLTTKLRDQQEREELRVKVHALTAERDAALVEWAVRRNYTGTVIARGDEQEARDFAAALNDGQPGTYTVLSRRISPWEDEPAAFGVAQTPTACGSCDGNRWVDDENWQPEHEGERARWRVPGSGRIPCGLCNEGGWQVPDGAQTPTADCGPTRPIYPHGCQQPDTAGQTDHERRTDAAQAELRHAVMAIAKAAEGITQAFASGMQKIADAHAADQRRIRERVAAENAAYATWKRERKGSQ